MSRVQRSDKSTSIHGVISTFELYTLDELKQRMGWTDSSLRSARLRGLRLLGFGKRRFVRGRDVVRFLEAWAAEQSHKS